MYTLSPRKPNPRKENGAPSPTPVRVITVGARPATREKRPFERELSKASDEDV